MTHQHILFWLFAVLAGGGAISVALSQSVVRMAVSLIVSLSAVSALFFMLGADFVGATQLMVYVGGTVVLLIFGVMLTASSPFAKIKTSPAEGFLAAGIGVLFLMVVAFTVAGVDWSNNSIKLLEGSAGSVSTTTGFNSAQQGNTVTPLAMSFLGVRPDRPNAPGYLLPFEIVSVHLLVVLVGAAYLARTKRAKRPQ